MLLNQIFQLRLLFYMYKTNFYPRISTYGETLKTPSDRTPVGKFIYSVSGTSSNAHITQVFLSGANKLVVTSTLTQSVHVTIVELYK